jgi:hypothetical protein
MGSAEKRPILASPPSNTPAPTLLTPDEMAFLKKQEVVGKISLHQPIYPSTTSFTTNTLASPSLSFTVPDPRYTNQHGFVYTHHPQEQPSTQPSSPNQTIPQSHTTIPKVSKQHFNLSIARSKLDFPSSSEEPMNWLRLCEKYFALANVPPNIWVPLGTLHYRGIAQTWWRSLRTPASFVLWSQFCNMVFSRFSPHSSHASLELFHHLKQTPTVTEYIQKFEDSMVMMQMEYPALTKPYFINNFIAGLKDGIKHYLVSHSAQTLSDTYWQAK